MSTTQTVVPLTFPEIRVKRVVRNGKDFVLDPVRKSFVRLTPEEWVRQHALGFLIESVKVPAGLIAVEKSLVYNTMRRRADVVAFDRSGRPLIVVECKAPEIAIHQNVFDQVSRYNKIFRAPYVIVTNGNEHYCFVVDFDKQSYEFLPKIPTYDALIDNQTSS